MNTKNYKGFTLVELLIAMAIISVLIGLSLGAISIAQQVSRDTQRRSAVQEVAAKLSAYINSNPIFPLEGSSSSCPTANTVCVDSNGDIRIGSNLIVDNAGPTEAYTGVSSTDANGTVYCYSRTAGGYVLGAQLEDGTYYELSTDKSVSAPSCDTVVLN